MTNPTREKPAKNRGIEGARLGPFLVGPRLGTGGAASVYLGLGIDAGSDGSSSCTRLVGLKVIHEHLAVEREFVAMFLDEARVATQLAHQNVVRTYELGDKDEILYMSMEYLHGHSLHEVFLRGTRHGARLPVDLIAWIGAEVARALQYAHALTDSHGNPIHLVHRDVSPRNIFITYDGGVKLIDFGIAQAVGRVAKTKVGHMKGTFSYIAPERALGGGCDHRADIFSLAVALHEACTGRRLFRGEDEVQTLQKVLSGEIPDPGEIRDGFPKEMTRILKKALAIDPSRRHQSARQLAAELDDFVKASGLEPPRPRLSLMMNALFADERERKESAIKQLCSLAVSADTDLTESVQEPSNLAVSRSKPPLSSIAPRAAHRWAVGLGTLASIAAAIIIATNHLAAQTEEPTPVRQSPIAAVIPTPSTVKLDVSAVPAVEATFELNDERVKGTFAHFEPRVGSTPLTIVVHANGYEDAQIGVIPDQNRTVAVPLRERAVEPTPSARVPAQPSAFPARPLPTKAKPTLSDMLNKRH